MERSFKSIYYALLRSMGMSKVNHLVLVLFLLLKVKGHFKGHFLKVIFGLFVRI